MRILLLSSLALSAAACAPEKPTIQQAGEEYTYACAGGKIFHVGFDEGFSYAIVKTGKATFEVPAVIAASGSRYADDKVEFWEHHGEAMLNGVPGETYADCKQTDPAPM